MKLIKKQFKQYKGKVYDLSVSTEDKSFIVNDCVVHNSSAGSLIAYLTNITEIDPIKYSLIFERFLNSARLAGGELPDVDSDIESKYRDDVKRYMEERYGFNYVSSVGTFGNFKIKSIIKDLGREMNLNYSDCNFMTSIIKDSTDGNMMDLMIESNKESKLKSFINKNHKLINKINLVIDNPKNQSIHASAVIILPKEDSEGNKRDIYSWIPVKKIDGILISEWEGKQNEKVGFLKEDILGLLQLDKFSMILKLIKQNRGIDIDWTKDIDVEDKQVYETLWQNGLTEDVFQFTTDNLKKYCKFLKPDCFEDLIAANALARPGAMTIGAHISYAKIKRGEIEMQLDYLLEDVTKDTYGLFVYQEQIMKAFQVITDASLEISDAFRKTMTKVESAENKDKEAIQKFKDIFLEAYVKKGSTEENAQFVLEKIMSFISYSFNKSHAACYAYESYVCNYFKFYYPLEFWVTSLKFSKDDDLEKKILEIEKAGMIELLPPDINQSSKEYGYNVEENKIYWALDSIKSAGEKSVEKIIEERNLNGHFKSLSDFLTRMNGKRINKTIIVNFILCGCFDKVENLENITKRYKLLHQYLREDLDLQEFSNENIGKKYFWLIKQKNLCGIGNIQFNKVYDNCKMNGSIKTFNGQKYLSFSDIHDTDFDGEDVVCLGIIDSCKTFNTKKGQACRLRLNENGNFLEVTLWADYWEKHQEEIRANVGKIFVGSGYVSFYNEKPSISHGKNSLFKIL